MKPCYLNQFCQYDNKIRGIFYLKFHLKEIIKYFFNYFVTLILFNQKEHFEKIFKNSGGWSCTLLTRTDPEALFIPIY